MIFKKEQYPLEKLIVSLMKENCYDIDKITSIVFLKYPFTKKHDLKKVVAELINKKINKHKISGKWIKLKQKWKMVSQRYNDLAHDDPPAFLEESKIPSDTGRSNRFAITPQGQDVDRYEIPKNEEFQRVYEQLKTKFGKELQGIEEGELVKIVFDEMRALGYEQSILDRIKK